MIVTSLIDNTSRTGFPTEHGLSLHIRLDDGRQILFDMGQRRLFAENAARLGIDLADVDLAVVSHGHYDHGGGLQAFLNLNHRATVYLNRHAFEAHYSLREEGLKYIGLNTDLKADHRLVYCEEETQAGSGLTLFANADGNFLRPSGNRLLFGPNPNVNDDFRHEQSLIIREGNKTVLVAGCAHNGIVNILRKGRQVAGCTFTHIFAGMHLTKSGLTEADENAFIRSLAEELMKEGGLYYTMHCTGLPQYEALKTRMGNAIHYLSCGENVIL